jgi:predicted ATPase
MSTYYVDKFLYTTDRDPDLLEQYKSEPAAYLQRWEREIGPRLSAAETTSWLSFTDQERTALIEHDYVTLFELGAHFFLSLTIYIGLYNDDYVEKYGPLSFQREYGAKLQHWLGKTYPSVVC